MKNNKIYLLQDYHNILAFQRKIFIIETDCDLCCNVNSKI